MNTIKANTPTTDRRSLARKPTRRDGGMAVGKTCYAFKRVVNSRLFKFMAQTRCLRCEAPLVVEFGTVAAALKIGNELVGILCDECLREEARGRLTELRDGIAAPRRWAVVSVRDIDTDDAATDDSAVRP